MDIIIKNWFIYFKQQQNIYKEHKYYYIIKLNMLTLMKKLISVLINIYIYICINK